MNKMLNGVIDFRNVLVKGGDLPASLDAVDVLYDGMFDTFLEILK